MSGFKSMLVKAALLKIPALKGYTEDLCERARAFAETTEDSDAGDEARVQLVLAAYELLNAGRRLRADRPAQEKP